MARTVQYASTRSEVWRWYWRSWRRRLWIKHAVLFLAIFVSVLMLRPGSIALAAAVGLTAIIWMPFFPLIRFKPQTRSLTVAERGISTVIGPRSAVLTWPQIRSVAEEDGAVIITSKNENASIVPAREFESETARAEFCYYAKELLRAERPSAT